MGPFFAFSPAIRRRIDTTNAIESPDRVSRKTLKTKGSFPAEEAATKPISRASRHFEKDGRTARERMAARNQLALLSDPRFTA